MTPLLRRWGLLFLIAGLCLITVYHYHLGGLPSWRRPPSSIGQYGQAGDKLPPAFEWKSVPTQYPVQNMIPLPTGAVVQIPQIQHDFGKESTERKKERKRRLAAVKDAFMYSWNAYKEHAWLHDEVLPVSGGYKDSFGGWGATLVDALDTLAIMGLHDELDNAIKALDEIDFSSSGQKELNVFETTIRYLGGFLAAYDVTDGKYTSLLDKAVELGEMLYKAFDTPNRMPITRWDWNSAALGAEQVAPDAVLLAEIGSLSLEFTRLSQLSGDPKYYDAVQRIANVMEKQQKETSIPGLWPIMVSASRVDFSQDKTFTLGGMADSAYEYLPKEYMLLGGQEAQYENMYESVIEAVKKHLLFRPLNSDNLDILISGSARAINSKSNKLNYEGQHLTCFAGGMVGIAAKIFDRPDELDIARKLVDGCIWAYESMPTGIMPEIFYAVPCDDNDNKLLDCAWTDEKWYEKLADVAAFNLDEDLAQQAKLYVEMAGIAPGMTKLQDRKYILRPEAIESVFMLYRITGDRILQDKAWTMFQAIEKMTKADISYASINDVSDVNSTRQDLSESFWMAETLKYFYLIFSDPDVISLDEYVFNTEAHPLKRPQAE